MKQPKTIDKVRKTRRARLNELVDSPRFGGVAARLGEALGYSSKSWVNELLTGKKPITERTARGIESKLKLPAGWLDGGK